MAETTGKRRMEKKDGKEREEEWKKDAMEKVITRNMKHEANCKLATPMDRMSAKLTSPQDVSGRERTKYVV